MKINNLKTLILALLLLNFTAALCQPSTPLIQEMLTDYPSIAGKDAYLNSAFVEAGNRLYIVGHQNGDFPELGWHIPGEMGGVWQHPIKLFDGLEALIISETDTLSLKNATSFTNFPTASMHTYHFAEKSLDIERWQFVADDFAGMAMQYLIKNTSSETKNLQLNFKAFSDLRPTWLGERTNMVDYKDETLYNTNEDYFLIKDSINPWFVVYNADRRSNRNQNILSPYQGIGVGSLLGYDLVIGPGETEVITFSFGSSHRSSYEAITNFRSIQNNLKKEIAEKNSRYRALQNKSKLTIPDKHLQQTFEWLKYNATWLVQEVPEIGKGVTAGIPDYPWWFGVDSEYALKGYMAVGQDEPVYATIQLLDSVSMAVNGNGKIIHEMSTNGAVFNDGNINETPQFASLIWEVYKWNGDLEFLKKYFPTIKKGLEWLLAKNDSNNNLFPDGFGMMEIHGMDSEMIDVAVYTQKAFDDAALMAGELGERALLEQYQRLADSLKTKINTEFWSEEFGSYADFIGTDKQALRLIEDAIIRADTLKKAWSVQELKSIKQYIINNPSDKPRPFVIHHNWVVNTPMEMNIADSAKARIALKTAEKYTNPFGVFVTGIDRDESSISQEESFKGGKVFTYTGAVMTLPTGVQVIAENNYGNPDKALEYLKRMSRSFSYAFPGSMYEVSPDYGMITQAWNLYSFAVPIVQQFFGIQPHASKKVVNIKPQMPKEWVTASLENVEMADNSISVHITQNAYEVVKTNDEWEIKLSLPKMNYVPPKESIKVESVGDRIIFSSYDNNLKILKKTSE